MSKQNDKDMSAVSPVEGGRRPIGTGGTKAAPKRFWAQHKTEAVLQRSPAGTDMQLFKTPTLFSRPLAHAFNLADAVPAVPNLGKRYGAIPPDDGSGRPSFLWQISNSGAKRVQCGSNT